MAAKTQINILSQNRKLIVPSKEILKNQYMIYLTSKKISVKETGKPGEGDFNILHDKAKS